MPERIHPLVEGIVGMEPSIANMQRPAQTDRAHHRHAGIPSKLRNLLRAWRPLEAERAHQGLQLFFWHHRNILQAQRSGHLSIEDTRTLRLC